MDGDAELKLQKASSELIQELETSVARYLTSTKGTRHSKTTELVNLLEPFQEWPQLLDPHLKRLIPPLVSSFLSRVVKHRDDYMRSGPNVSNDLIPLTRGISRLLYTFCKVRGYKVISHFFSNEPRYLEPMLDAYEQWSQQRCFDSEQPPGVPVMTWEEKYVMLLWISHLMLTPFDLATISSTGDPELGTLPGGFSPRMPSAARRAIQLALNSLSEASKEREAAGILLARVALRPDMAQYRLLDSTIDMALASLSNKADGSGATSIYVHVGALSFLSGVATAADSNIINAFLPIIFRDVHAISSQDSAQRKEIYSSASARKLIIKVLRAITIHVLHNISAGHGQLSGEDILEEVIDHMLNGLADKDTPVRYAASKALSIITAKLDPEMAADIVEALTGSLEENVSWVDLTSGKVFANYDLGTVTSQSWKCNLTAVNPLRWHGLVLALSQLLYRRSPPPNQLPSILNALILALSFEQRSAVGASIGTNVRDAACFGIWALARRYTTEELLGIDTALIRVASLSKQSQSILQLLANEIVAAACLDPSGNIRRGASAALQELIGRHPDTIEQGISIVQVVDYHAVALRSRALIEVSLVASLLHSTYWCNLLDGLLGWRGVGSPDAPSRREAATAIGELSHLGTEKTLPEIRKSLAQTAARQVEERHGLLLALAAVVAKCEQNQSDARRLSLPGLISLTQIFQDAHLSDRNFTTSTLRPQLAAEASCKLIAAIGSAARSQKPIAKIAWDIFMASFDRSAEFIDLSLRRTEDVVIDAATQAGKELIHFSTGTALIETWLSTINNKKLRGKPYGTIAVLGVALAQFDPEAKLSARIIETLLSQLDPQREIETRVWAVKSLRPFIQRDDAHLDESIIQALSRCLDDYTTDQRGDVGSLLRLEAINAVDVALRSHDDLEQSSREMLLSRICRLSVEKLDKVRNCAWACLENHHCLLFIQPPRLPSTSTSTYFTHVLALTLKNCYLLVHVLSGLITSATSGSDSLLSASRSALASHVDILSDSELLHLISSLLSILSGNIQNERIALPALSTLAFIGEINVLERLTARESSFDPSPVLALVAKCHYKTTNVRKLMAALSCYSSLCYISSIRDAALGKLCNLLLHPYPMVRLLPQKHIGILNTEIR